MYYRLLLSLHHITCITLNYNVLQVLHDITAITSYYRHYNVLHKLQTITSYYKHYMTLQIIQALHCITLYYIRLHGLHDITAITWHYITLQVEPAWICIILSCSSPPNLPSQLPPQETHLCCSANYVLCYTLAQMHTTKQRLLGVPSSLLQHCQTHERFSSSVRGAVTSRTHAGPSQLFQVICRVHVRVASRRHIIR